MSPCSRMPSGAASSKRIKRALLYHLSYAPTLIECNTVQSSLLYRCRTVSLPVAGVVAVLPDAAGGALESVAGRGEDPTDISGRMLEDRRVESLQQFLAERAWLLARVITKRRYS